MIPTVDVSRGPLACGSKKWVYSHKPLSGIVITGIAVTVEFW